MLPVLYAGFNQWENGYEEKHAKEFTKEQLLALHELPNNGYSNNNDDDDHDNNDDDNDVQILE